MDQTLLCQLNNAGLVFPGDPQHKPVLHELSWAIRKGEHTVLIGKNGAGKTTLLRIIRGEAWVTQGTCAWRDNDGSMTTSRIIGQAVTAMVSPSQQEYFQRSARGLNGKELLLTGFDGTPMLYTQPDSKREELAEAMACELDCVHLLKRNVTEISQGQLRILLLARAMLRQPSLLLLDECTDGLDARHRELFAASLKKLSESSTIIMTTHRASFLPAWIKNTLYLDNGTLTQEPPAGREDVQEASSRIEIQSGMIPAHEEAKPLVDVENATVYLAGRPVLHDITWQFMQGEHWLLQGENGSGKSTFLHMLASDVPVAWPGRITFNLPQDDSIPFASIRRRIRLVSDANQALYEYDVTCLELVLSGLENSVGIYRDFSREEKELAEEQLEKVGLKGFADRSIRQVSTGQLRRAFLARALMGCPMALLLDEACTGLDERARYKYLDVLDTLADEGLSYVFISHYEEDTPQTINRHALMKHGCLEEC